MSPENFIYWLKGYFEISQHSGESKTLNEKQVEEIQNHLNLVLTKVTPELSQPKDPQVTLPFPVDFAPVDFGQVYCCSTTDIPQITTQTIGGINEPTFLEQWKLDEESKKNYSKKIQPYYKSNREPGRAC
jgi:hypothetical protein